MQLDGPGRAGDGVREPDPRPDLVDGELVDGLHPAGLATARAARRSARRPCRTTSGNSARRNSTTRSAWALPSSWACGGGERVEGRLDVGHVQHGGAPAGEEEREPVVAAQAVLGGLRADPGGEVRGVGRLRLVRFSTTSCWLP